MGLCNISQEVLHCATSSLKCFFLPSSVTYLFLSFCFHLLLFIHELKYWGSLEILCYCIQCNMIKEWNFVMPTWCFHWSSWHLSCSFSLCVCILNKVEEKGNCEVHFSTVPLWLWISWNKLFQNSQPLLHTVHSSLAIYKCCREV